MADTSSKARARRHVARVRRIDRWLERGGVQDARTRSHIAVDLGDALEAMEEIRKHARLMLRCDPATKRGADRALTHAVGVEIQAFDELLYHLNGLRRRWEPCVEEVLDRRSEGKAPKHAAA